MAKILIIIAALVLVVGIPVVVYTTRDKSDTSFLDRDLRGYDSYVRGTRRTPPSLIEDSNRQ